MRPLPPCAAASRRAVLVAAIAAVSPPLRAPALAADTESALWPRDGLFPDCPGADVCWDNPWIFEGKLENSYTKLQRVIEKKLGGKIVESDGERYLRAEFQESSPLGSSVDDAEFFFTPDDTLVQFRAIRRGQTAGTDFGANRKRLEKARIALGWEKVPVLRNRRRALVIVESPLDSFGPALYSESYSDSDPKAVPFQPPTKFERAWMRESDDRVRSR